MCDSRSLFITAREVAGTKIFGDISTGAFRPLVPPAFREAATSTLHGVAHPGVEATVKLVTSKFCWPGIRRYVRRYAQQCVSCQKSKVARHVHLWWALFHSLLGSPTYSQWWTEPRAGRKQSLSAASPPPIAQPLSSRAGFNGSVFPLS
jgi:hypothetical protein